MGVKGLPLTRAFKWKTHTYTFVKQSVLCVKGRQPQASSATPQHNHGPPTKSRRPCCACPAHGCRVSMWTLCVSTGLVERVFQERSLEVWMPVDFCSSLRSSQGILAACRSVWTAASASLPPQQHHALLWLAPEKARNHMQISQLTDVIKENNIKMQWSFCHRRGAPGPPERKVKKTKHKPSVCGHWPHLGLLTPPAYFVPFEAISSDCIVFLMPSFWGRAITDGHTFLPVTMLW